MNAVFRLRSNSNILMKIGFSVLFLSLVIGSQVFGEDAVQPEKKVDLVAPETSSHKCQDGFCGWLIVTADPDWQSKWRASSSNIPQILETDVVRRGGKIAVVPFYSNPSADKNGMVDIDCDIRLIRPDGSMNIDQKDVPCAQGKLRRSRLHFAKAGITFTADPQALPGKWRVEITLKDKTRPTYLQLRTEFELKEKNQR